MNDRPSIAEVSLSFTGIFEAELLVSLMLREWKHPLADNRNFQENLLESAAEILRSSIAGEQIIDGLKPESINLVAALWAAESTTLELGRTIPEADRKLREAWLAAVRRTVPSCFCDPDLLP